MATVHAQDDAPQGIAIAQAAICLDVVEHQPVAEADSFASDVGSLKCWTKVVAGSGQSIVHAWIHEGVTRARVELAVRSDSWRTYSSKRILPEWTGRWEVKVLTADGVVLRSIPFVVR